ncbi:hypothetical protein H9657_02005 [Cellulomonas sp. Sa3CUA2]|uniref:Beta-ketoacyl-[acyl-carrier-protein] synthase III C-terminal domain-containing protein n=1 Tax=Cellulomonas avistercoris TaxID=2762242 RepID=A0ABR8Q9E7_9CELL|nr:3-oxoacyl-[acyl-carrier-protein] synthase III C-terminal domain-containing protein [Cellulomonas avistercoris]MBD7917056.1 hypothetical protein [Cellulomonas avistercoris]
MRDGQVTVSFLPATDVYLAHVAHALGSPVALAELPDAAVAGDAPARRAVLAAEGIGGCLVGDGSKVGSARRAAVASAAGAGSGVDAVLMCTDTAPDRSPSLDLWDVVSEVGAPHVTAATVGGHGCGNLGAATQLGLDLISGGRESALVVTADRVDPGASRFLESGRTLLSDGAAAAVLTTVRPGHGYRVLAVAAGGSPARPVGAGGLRGAAPLVAGLGRAVAAVHDASGTGPSDVRHVLPGNVGASARAMIAMAVRARPERVYAPSAASFGHCYSADLLVALAEAPARGDVADGDVVLLVPTSVRSWFVLALQYVTAPRADGPGMLSEEIA